VTDGRQAILPSIRIQKKGATHNDFSKLPYFIILSDFTKKQFLLLQRFSLDFVCMYGWLTIVLVHIEKEPSKVVVNNN